MATASESPKKPEIRKVPSRAMCFEAGPCQFAAAAEGSRNVPVTIVARTGQPVDHWYWGKVIHDMLGLKVHKKSLTLDYLHSDHEILGYLDQFDTSSGDLVVGGELVPYADGDRAAEVIYKARNLVPYEASIHFDGPVRIEEVGSGTTAKVNGYEVEGPATIFRQWSLRGVAICPHGYDRNTKTELTAGEADVPVEFFNEEKSPMPDPSTQPSPEQLSKPAKPEQPAALSTQPAAATEQLSENPKSGIENQKSQSPDPRAECKRFIDAFGAEGATWFAEGKTFDEAQTLHAGRLSAENAELKKKLGAVALGETEPLTFADGERGGKASEAQAANYGDKLSALVAHNAQCIGKKK